MKEKKYRAQLLLEPRQREALAEMARREHRSISELARRVLDAGLATLRMKARCGSAGKSPCGR